MQETNIFRQNKKSISKSLRIWMSKSKKEIFFSEILEYEPMLFKSYEELMEHVRACIECGYKVG
jgi:hypothetical protein